MQSLIIVERKQSLELFNSLLHESTLAALISKKVLVSVLLSVIPALYLLGIGSIPNFAHYTHVAYPYRSANQL